MGRTCRGFSSAQPIGASRAVRTLAISTLAIKPLSGGAGSGGKVPGEGYRAEQETAATRTSRSLVEQRSQPASVTSPGQPALDAGSSHGAALLGTSDGTMLPETGG